MLNYDTRQARTDLFEIGKGNAQLVDTKVATDIAKHNDAQAALKAEKEQKRKDAQDADLNIALAALNDEVKPGDTQLFADKAKGIRDYVYTNIKALENGDVKTKLELNRQLADFHGQAKQSQFTLQQGKEMLANANKNGGEENYRGTQDVRDMLYSPKYAGKYNIGDYPVSQIVNLDEIVQKDVDDQIGKLDNKYNTVSMLPEREGVARVTQLVNEPKVRNEVIHRIKEEAQAGTLKNLGLGEDPTKIGPVDYMVAKYKDRYKYTKEKLLPEYATGNGNKEDSKKIMATVTQKGNNTQIDFGGAKQPIIELPSGYKGKLVSFNYQKGADGSEGGQGVVKRILTTQEIKDNNKIQTAWEKSGKKEPFETFASKPKRIEGKDLEYTPPTEKIDYVTYENGLVNSGYLAEGENPYTILDGTGKKIGVHSHDMGESTVTKPTGVGKTGKKIILPH